MPYPWIIWLLFLIVQSGSLSADRVFNQIYKDGTSIGIDLSKKNVSVDEKLQITLDIEFSARWRLNKMLLKQNLLSYVGYGARPFELISEESSVEGNLHRLTYFLDPEIPGNHSLTFGTVVLEPLDQTLNSLYLPTGLFDVMIEPMKEIPYLGDPAALMPLSLDYPVTLTPQNRFNFVESPKVYQEEEEKQRMLFLSQGLYKLIFFMVLLIKGIAILLLYLSLTLRKKGLLYKKPLKNVRALALERLNILEQQGVGGDPTSTYREISLVLRNFLERAAGIKLTAMTTREYFLVAAHQLSIDESKKEALGKLLSDADLVKFALEPVNWDQTRVALKLAAQFIMSYPLKEEPEEKSRLLFFLNGRVGDLALRITTMWQALKS